MLNGFIALYIDCLAFKRFNKHIVNKRPYWCHKRSLKNEKIWAQKNTMF